LRQVLLGAADSGAALAGHHLRLVPDAPGGLRIVAGSGRPWLDVILETVAQSAARGDCQRVKLCTAPDWHWVFYDTSRSGRGRWCSMEVCGNRHKTRTYRERHRPAG
jgi:predicted RNA-binding Zn ribbon-like protein